VRPLRTAEIIAVGSELLTAHRVDTNSLFLTGRLEDLGVEVRAKAVVGDRRADLATLLREALSRADVVITTGGLGPTDDDLTREVVADVLDRPLREEAGILAGIRARFDRRGVRMPAINQRQAMVPAGATVLPNPNGTAPGLWLESADRIVVLLPGPPRELQPMFDAHVAPRLGALAGGRRIRRRVIKVHGRSESQVEEIAFPIYSTLGDAVIPVETTILATPGQIELHLAAAGEDMAALDARLEAGVTRLSAALGDVVFSTDGRSLERVVGDLLQARGWHVAAAESCTAGLVMARLTDVPGSSAWVAGGVVAYANDVKVAQLGVAASLIEAHGAVSEPVAVAMAEGVRARLGADLAVAVTGIAGPSGGSTAKPVGTVVIAVAMDGAPASVRTLLFPGDRTTARTHFTFAALDALRRALLLAPRSS
jgi:nicotinamide-nucleotide amidase